MAFISSDGTIGNCQSAVFSLGVSQHVYKITTCEILKSIGRQICEIITEEKIPLYCPTKLWLSDA